MRVSRLFGDWGFDASVLIPIILAGSAYLCGAYRARPRWNGRRTGRFVAGLGALILASQSGIDTWSGRLLSAHMVAHLLIIMVAAPLLVGGAPVSLALRALPRGGADGLLRLLRTRPVQVLAHPAAALLVFSVVLVGTHVPAAYDLALRVPFVHAIEHALYLWVGVLFWAPVVALDPLPHRLSPVGVIAYLLVAMIPMSAVGAWLISKDLIVYAPYAATARRLGISAVSDQRSGATIMWLGGTLVLVVATLGAAWAAMVREERRERVREEKEFALGASQ